MPTVIVIAEVPEPGAGIACGLKLTVVPEGTPEADRLTALLNPPLMVEVMVELPWFPCGTVTEAGDADNEKSGEVATCATPKKAMVVLSPLCVVPTTTVRRLPVSVTWRLMLLPGHAAADQLFACAS